MVSAGGVVAGAAAVLLPLCLGESLYPRSSAVLPVDGARYYNEVQQSNHTSIIEFYAPWCGHCKQLQPAYEKVARSLAGLARVGAVNCDEDSNKSFCGRMGVEGFPTLKIVRPGKTPGKPIVESYNGPRTAAGIVAAVKEKINNHVHRLTDDGFEKWLSEGVEKPKAILYSDKGTTSALLKALAIDFLGNIKIAQARDNQKKLIKRHDVSTFPSFVLYTGKGDETIKYDGKFEKAELIKFLSQAAAPNQDPAPKAKKAKPSSASKTPTKAESSKPKQTPAAHGKEQQILVEDPIESPSPNVADDSKLGDLPVLPLLLSDEAVQSQCLTPTSKSCGLIFQPIEATSEREVEASTALTTLGKLHANFVRSGKLFPIYGVPNAEKVRSQLGIGNDEIGAVVVNAKHGWLKRFDGKAKGWTKVALEEWIDSMRFGEGRKEKLSDGVVGDFSPRSSSTSSSSSPSSSSSSTPSSAPDGVKSAASSATEKVKASASSVTEKIKEAGKSASSAAGDAASSASAVVSEDVTLASSAAGECATSAGEEGLCKAPSAKDEVEGETVEESEVVGEKTVPEHEEL